MGDYMIFDDVPRPPTDLSGFQAAPEIFDWLHNGILDIHHDNFNEDHLHLRDYRFSEISYMWAAGGYEKKGRRVIGECEQVAFMAGGWKRERQEDWMRSKLGCIPKYLMTFDAEYCRDCTNNQLAALIDHELYHIAHKKDAYGQPAFGKDGRARLAMAAHDIEEFFGIVDRYGADDDIKKMIELAKR